MAEAFASVSDGYSSIVCFVGMSESATSWYWDFGDGTTSTEQNPVHTYSALGSYKVTLTVSNDYGTDSTTRLIGVWTLLSKTVLKLLLI